MAGETPTISTSHYASTNLAFPDLVSGTSTWSSRLGQRDFDLGLNLLQETEEGEEESEETVADKKVHRRIVTVFIVDPDERVPLESCVLYEGQQRLTDLTDQELFFETPIVERLKAHNDVRENIVDEEATRRAGQNVMLKPIKIRDLHMTVVTIATFGS